MADCGECKRSVFGECPDHKHEREASQRPLKTCGLRPGTPDGVPCTFPPLHRGECSWERDVLAKPRHTAELK